jgi:hypothetical protein
MTSPVELSMMQGTTDGVLTECNAVHMHVVSFQSSPVFSLAVPLFDVAIGADNVTRVQHCC